MYLSLPSHLFGKIRSNQSLVSVSLHTSRCGNQAWGWRAQIVHNINVPGKSTELWSMSAVQGESVPILTWSYPSILPSPGSSCMSTVRSNVIGASHVEGKLSVGLLMRGDYTIRIIIIYFAMISFILQTHNFSCRSRM